MDDRRRLLVALDGTRFSDAAAELGLRWSLDIGASLSGLAIVDEPAIQKPEAMSIGASHYAAKAHERRLREASTAVDAILQAFERRCRDAGVACESLHGQGTPLDVILEESHRFDLILMGSHTYFEFATRETEDHVLDEVLRHSPRPIVATPDRLPAGERIVIAYDGSDAAARALQSFQMLYEKPLGPVQVLSLRPTTEEAAALAARAVDFLSFHGIASTAVPVAVRHRTDDVLIEKACELRPRLVVMGGQSHSRLHDRLLGSTTRRMLDRCGVPLFLYH